MNLEAVTDAAHPMYQKALALYRLSFPLHEQRELPSQERILLDREYHFCLVCDQSVFIGLVLYWETDDAIYIEHLCILPELRNKKYGEQVLSALKARHKTVILEIDPPADSVSERRKGFYERCGFVENPYRLGHPPYHRGNSGHSLVVMTYPKPISPKEYRAFNEYLCGKIMDKAF